MDTSHHHIPLDVQRLREALSSRDDSYWELLAAAVGSRQAVKRLQSALSREQLDLGAEGNAIAPSFVRERVEALAAYDSRPLIEIARSWRPPYELSGSPFWVAAWSVALRHLKEHNAINWINTNEPELDSEAAILWPTQEIGPRSWSEFVDGYRAHFTPYNRIRLWANTRLLDTSISARQIEELPVLVLRIMRGREHILDQSARHYLRSVADNLVSLDPLEAAILLEILSKFDPGVTIRARDELVARLHSLQDARAVIPLAYVLVSQHWRTP